MLLLGLRAVGWRCRFGFGGFHGRHQQQDQQSTDHFAGRPAPLAQPGESQLQVPAFQPGAFVQIQGKTTGHIEGFGDAQHQVKAQSGDSQLQRTLVVEPVAQFQVELPGHQHIQQRHQPERHELLQVQHQQGQHARPVGRIAVEYFQPLAGGVTFDLFKLPDAGIEAAHGAQASPGELASQPR